MSELYETLMVVVDDGSSRLSVEKKTVTTIATKIACVNSGGDGGGGWYLYVEHGVLHFYPFENFDVIYVWMLSFFSTFATSTLDLIIQIAPA